MAFRITIKANSDEIEKRIADSEKRGYVLINRGKSEPDLRTGSRARYKDRKQRKSDYRYYDGLDREWAVMEKQSWIYTLQT